MTRERWGTFSVIDHKNSAALVPEVLLYDRLVLPVPMSPDERIRWSGRGWAPEILDQRLAQLGTLAVQANWNYDDRTQVIKAWEQRLRTIRQDADQILRDIKEKSPFQMTRMVLANSQPVVLPEGVTSVVSVAAFQSQQEFDSCYRLQSLENDRASLGFLLGQRLAVPHDENPEHALEKAIVLVRENEKFREHRRKLYEWQENALRDRITPENAAKEMDQLVADYNRCVEQATQNVYYKFAFTVAGVALGLAAAPLSIPFATATVLLALVQFTTLDRQPVIEPGESAPAAMFHDVQKIGLWHSA